MITFVESLIGMGMSGKKRVSLKDLAEELGVSVSTV